MIACDMNNVILIKVVELQLEVAPHKCEALRRITAC